MKRLLLSMMAMLAAATLAAAENQPGPANPKSGKPALTDEQRAQAEQKLDEAWSKLPFETKARIMRLHRALTLMPPEERQFLHDRLERFLNMSPEEREHLRMNIKRWQAMTPEERQQARELFRQRRQAFEEKWRQEHPGEEPPPYPYHGKPAPSPAPAPTPAPETNN